MNSEFFAVFCLMVGAGGCGGQVDSNQAPSPGPTDTSSNTSSGGSQNANASDPTKLLADCGPGFVPQEATADKPCNFFVGPACYSTQDEACGCACPRESGPVLCVADGNAHLAGTDAYGVWCEPVSG